MQIKIITYQIKMKNIIRICMLYIILNRHYKGFSGGLMVKHPLPMPEMWIQSLGGEEGNGQPFLPGKSDGERNLEGYSPWGHKRTGHNLATKIHI